MWGTYIDSFINISHPPLNPFFDPIYISYPKGLFLLEVWSYWKQIRVRFAKKAMF